MGVRLECKDDGPLIEWGEDSTDTDDGNGGGTHFEGGFFDVNTEKVGELLEDIADLFDRLFGGGETPPEGGGETPPEGGGETPPEGGEETPPEGGEETPPADGETGGDTGDASTGTGPIRSYTISVANSRIGYMRVHRGFSVLGGRAVLVPGTYRRVDDGLTVNLRKRPKGK